MFLTGCNYYYYSVAFDARTFRLSRVNTRIKIKYYYDDCVVPARRIRSTGENAAGGKEKKIYRNLF